jgi:gamma-glutamyltranspeptidase/glutathione hydrolase
MVAATQPLAVRAGIDTLAAGGNAADAAVATAAALAVTEPTSTGIGGDCFALFYNAADRSVTAMNGSGRSPMALNFDRLREDGLTHLPPYHGHTVTVPGACAGWCDLIARRGRLPISKVLAPAIRFAEEGYPVAPLTSHSWQKGLPQLQLSAHGTEMTIDGRAPRPGEIFRNPGLAKVLRTVAEGGARAFYQGPIARAIVDAVAQAAGVLSEADLASHTTTWDDPISTVYRGVRVWECAPNGQGLCALIALNILSGFDRNTLGDPGSARRLHLQIEAMRLAFADAQRYIADPAFGELPIDALLSGEYADRRRKRINVDHAMARVKHGSPLASSDTVYLCVVDADGNACSFINSNYMGFGTGIVPRGCGFTLQNRGHNFSLEPGHPNALAPGKRPYHTIIPALATRESDGELLAPFGVMGGFMQPQGHVQVLSAIVDDDLDPQAALDRPRFCITPDSPSANPVQLEDGIAPEALESLQKLGHAITLVRGLDRSVFGRGQIIWRDPATRVLCAGSDPRGDGCAMPL